MNQQSLLRRLAAAVAGCFLLTSTAAGALAAPNGMDSSRTVINSGHTDGFFVALRGDEPVVETHNGWPNTVYDPNEIAFEIADSTYADDLELEGIKPTGTVGYYSTLADRWFEPGWSTSALSDERVKSVKIEFTSLWGPGPVALVGNGALLPQNGSLVSDNATTPFLEKGYYYLQKGRALPIEGHTHGHWFFVYPGVYRISGKAIVGLHDGRKLESAPFTLEIRVEKNEEDTREIPASHEVSAPLGDKGVPGTTDSTADSADSTDVDDEDDADDADDEDDEEADDSENNEDGNPVPGTCAKPIVISHGHIDLFNVSSKDRQLSLNAKEDFTGLGVIRDSCEFILEVPQSARQAIPENLQDKLPAQGYYLAQNGTNQQTEPFPGWDTSGVKPDFESIDINFREVTGPGEVYLFADAPRGGLTHVLTSKSYRLTSGTTIRQQTPSHVHAHWLFSEPGTYTMKVQAAGTSLSGGETVRSNEAIYTWKVGKPGGSSETGKTDSVSPQRNPNPKPNPKLKPSSEVIDSESAEDPEEEETDEAAQETVKPKKTARRGTEVILRQGHYDVFNVEADRGRIRLEISGDKGKFHPEDVILNVGKNTFKSKSMPAAWKQALGINKGYILTESNANSATQLWPGWSTFAVRPQFSRVALRFLSVSGPGDVFLFKNGTLGAGFISVLSSGSYQLNSGATLDIADPAHIHANWVFTAPGKYTMKVQAAAYPVDGGKPVFSPAVKYTWKVGKVSGSRPTAEEAAEDEMLEEEVPDEENAAENGEKSAGKTAPGNLKGQRISGLPANSAQNSAFNGGNTGTTYARTGLDNAASSRKALGGKTASKRAGSLARTGASEAAALLGLSLALILGGGALLRKSRREAR